VEIPLGARIIAVCDSFDAMISERPYARRRTDDQALAELRRCAGSQFDPQIVEAFERLLRERAHAPTATAPS
jgi:HD-GYP domain-containing protein (c-di-GMP phosphodiesterase class II)